MQKTRKAGPLFDLRERARAQERLAAQTFSKSCRRRERRNEILSLLLLPAPDLSKLSQPRGQAKKLWLKSRTCFKMRRMFRGPMTSLDRLYIFYRVPRERFRQLLAIYGRKPEDRLPDARTFLNRFAAHKSNYLLGFITDPATALFLISWDISALRGNVFAALGSFFFGLLTWTLLE